jgi:hypothetical protein
MSRTDVRHWKYYRHATRPSKVRMHQPAAYLAHLCSKETRRACIHPCPLRRLSWPFRTSKDNQARQTREERVVFIT